MKKQIVDWWIGGSSYTSEYQAVLSRATALGYTLPSNSTKTAQNQLIVDLKSAGVWSLLDVFYVPMANDANLQNFARINWVSPSSYLATLNAPNYGTGGFTGNGTSAYYQSGYSPASNGVNVSLNNASYFVWCNTNSQEGRSVFSGGYNAVSEYRMNLSPRFDPTNSYSRCNSTGDDTINNASAGITSSLGLWQMSRTISTEYKLYQNGTLKTTVSKASSHLPVSFDMLALTQNLVFGAWSTRQFSMAGAGSGSISPTDLYTAWNTYKTAIGL